MRIGGISDHQAAYFRRCKSDRNGKRHSSGRAEWRTALRTEWRAEWMRQPIPGSLGLSFPTANRQPLPPDMGRAVIAITAVGDRRWTNRRAIASRPDTAYPSANGRDAVAPLPHVASASQPASVPAEPHAAFRPRLLRSRSPCQQFPARLCRAALTAPDTDPADRRATRRRTGWRGPAVRNTDDPCRRPST